MTDPVVFQDTEEGGIYHLRPAPQKGRGALPEDWVVELVAVGPEHDIGALGPIGRLRCPPVQYVGKGVVSPLTGKRVLPDYTDQVREEAVEIPEMPLDRRPCWELAWDLGDNKWVEMWNWNWIGPALRWLANQASTHAIIRRKDPAYAARHIDPKTMPCGAQMVGRREPMMPGRDHNRLKQGLMR